VTGSWWLDTNNLCIWVYDNPSGQTLEASQRTNASTPLVAGNYNGADGFELYDTPGLVISDVTANYNGQQPADLYLAGIKWDPSSGSVSPRSNGRSRDLTAFTHKRNSLRQLNTMMTVGNHESHRFVRTTPI
jgi:hypothetical protein